jgi:uncharacterized protein
MNRDTALAIIRQHEADLKALGVISLSLFGSTARNEATVHSDVDVAVKLDEIRSGFATFRRLEQIQDRLRALLHTRVDVIPEPKRPGPVKFAIDKDRCLAF